MTAGPSMSATWACVRASLRARAGALVALALIAGVAGGLTLATVAGARRAATAFDRRLEASGTPNIDIEFDEPQERSVVDRVAAVEGVDGVTLVAAVATGPAEVDRTPFEDVIAFAVVAEAGTGASDHLLSEGSFLSGAPGEVLLNSEMARIAGAEVGDEVTLAAVSAENGESFLGGTVGVEGPVTPAEVVGIARGAEDVSDAPDPALLVPYSYVEQNDVFALPMLVWVRTDEANVDEVLVELRRRFPEAEVLPTEGLSERIADGIDVQVVGLLALAVAIGFAGLAAIVQAVGRIAGASAADDGVAGALGMTSNERRFVAVWRVAPAALVAALLVVVVGVLGGPFAVSGLARQAEPDRGVWFDPIATTSAVLAVLLAVLGTAAMSVRRRDAASAPPTRVGPVDRALAAGAPLVPSIGARRAFGDTGQRWTASAGLVAVTAGVAVVVAVLTFARSIDALFESPAQWGAVFDAILDAESDDAARADQVAALQADPDIASAGLAVLGAVSAGRPDGPQAVYQLSAVDSFKGDIQQLVVDGMPLRADDEAIVGSAVLEDLGLRVGDELVVETRTTHVLRIVGEAVIYGDDRIDDGIAVTVPGAQAIGAFDDQDLLIVVRFAAGVDAEDKLSQLGDVADPVEPPGSVDNLDELGSLPLVLAIVVAGLGAFAGAVAVVAGTNRSRRELSTLRALGARPRQVGGTVVFHALALGVVGVVLGIPIGLTLGRAVYLAVAEGIGAVTRPVVPALAVAAVAAGAVVVLLVVASIPATHAARRAARWTRRSESLSGPAVGAR